MVSSRAKTSHGHGIGPLPLPVGNLTSENIPADSTKETSKTVGEYSLDQSVHVDRLTAVKYCSNPELYLTEASCTYIPRDIYESLEGYQVRLGRAYSSFQPFYTHLRNLIVGTALRKAIQLPDDIPTEWSDLLDNIDLEGHSLHSFAKTIFTASIDGGCAGIFVEYPESEGELTLADERSKAYRPYFVAIPTVDVLGWSSEVSATTLGDKTVYGRKLTSLRIRDEVREQSPDDEFMDVIHPAVRVYDFDSESEQVRFRYYVCREKSQNVASEYYLEKTSYLSVSTIPFVPVYGGTKEGFMLARPMLLDVARLNLHHWSVSADLANQLHLSASPKFVISGVQGGSAEFENSPDKILILDKPEAKAVWIGAPMDGASTIMEQLKSLEGAMEKLAAVAMVNKQTNQAESGISKLLDRAQSDSLLAVLVQGLEEALNTAITIAAEYWNKGNPIKVSLSRDFVPVRLHSQQILAYIELYNSNVISHKTFLDILAVGDVFDGLPDFDVMEEISLIGSQPGNTGLDVNKDIESFKSVNGRPTTTRIEGRRPRQGAESGPEAREVSRPSIAGG